MKKIVLLLLVGAVTAFQFCSSTKKAQASNAVAKTTYEANVHPIIMSSCSPCHIAGQGKVKALNNYEASKSEAEDIIARIKRNPDEKGFMPFKHPKLSDSTINVFVKWKDDGLTEK